MMKRREGEGLQSETGPPKGNGDCRNSTDTSVGVEVSRAQSPTCQLYCHREPAQVDSGPQVGAPCVSATAAPDCSVN